MIKLIVSDMDGTLLDSNHNFAPDFFEVLSELNKKGIIFTVASGRSKYALEEVMGTHKDEVMYISDNGGCVFGNGFDEVILPLTHAQAQSTVEQCLKVNMLQTVMCTKEKAYFVRPIEEYIPMVSFYYPTYEIIRDYTQIEEQILKVAGFDPLCSAENAYPQLKNKLDKDLRVVVSSVNWIDIMNKDLNKGYTVKKLQEALGVTEEETMAFGDFNKDIEMLKEAKYSFAMKNSNPQVKAAANFEAPSNDDYGVVQMIKKYAL